MADGEKNAKKLMRRNKALAAPASSSRVAPTDLTKDPQSAKFVSAWQKLRKRKPADPGLGV